MTGPSAMGSLKGIPSSMTVEPTCASSTINSFVVSRSGSPAVMKGMKPLRPSLLRLANVSVIRDRTIYHRGHRQPLLFSVFLCVLCGQIFSHRINVFITAPGQIDNHYLVRLRLSSQFQTVRNGM